MNPQTERTPESLGLLASGAAGRWHVDIDEALDRDTWFLELDGPAAYLVVELSDLGAIERARRYLLEPAATGFLLGRLGAAPVTLHWDDEDFVRCFIIISPEGHGAARLTLDAEDARMISEALRQAVAELPE